MMCSMLLFLETIFLNIKCEPFKLVLIRDGESEWNQLNLFTGWADIPLSDKGKEESIKSGKLLKEKGFKFDYCFTSVLKRAIQTTFYKVIYLY